MTPAENDPNFDPLSDLKYNSYQYSGLSFPWKGFSDSQLQSVSEQMQKSISIRTVSDKQQLSEELFRIYKTVDLKKLNVICCASKTNRNVHVFITIGNVQKLQENLRGPNSSGDSPDKLFEQADHRFTILTEGAAEFPSESMNLQWMARSSWKVKIELTFIGTQGSLMQGNEACYNIEKIRQALLENV